MADPGIPPPPEAGYFKAGYTPASEAVQVFFDILRICSSIDIIAKAGLKLRANTMQDLNKKIHTKLAGPAGYPDRGGLSKDVTSCFLCVIL